MCKKFIYIAFSDIINIRFPAILYTLIHVRVLMYIKISLTVLGMILGIGATGLLTAVSMSETALALGTGGGCGSGPNGQGGCGGTLIGGSEGTGGMGIGGGFGEGGGSFSGSPNTAPRSARAVSMPSSVSEGIHQPRVYSPR